jgi:integrase
MERRPTKNGYRYRAKVYIYGKPKTKTFKRKADAERWETNSKIERDKALALGLSVPKEISLKNFSEIWLQNQTALQPRTKDRYSGILRNYLIPLFGNLNLSRIRISHGEELVLSLKKTLSPNSINLGIKVFKAILNYAVRLEYLHKSPFGNLDQVKVPPKENLFWTINEISKFLSYIKEDDYFAFFLVALNTGMRLGELLGLCWDKVDFDRKQIEVFRTRDRHGLKNTTKTGMKRFVPMNPAVLGALRTLREGRRSMNLVFVDKSGRPPDFNHIGDRYFHKASQRAGVRKIRFHDLRHTFASHFIMRGGNIFTLSEILGHSSVEMTSKRYAHLSKEYLEDSIGIINFDSDSPNLAPKSLEIVQNA